ncbi:MAG: hypothetical protein STHCBS139747_002918 [Sporothrix thermara]
MEAHLLRVLVGPDPREFVVHRALLRASSAFFRDSLDAAPHGHAASPEHPSSPSFFSHSSSPSSPLSPSSLTNPGTTTSVLWLAGESADVFELFVLWLYRRHAFRAVVEDAVNVLAREAEPGEDIELLPENSSSFSSSSGSAASRNLSDLHWHLVRLHLFATFVDIPVLQDVVMDTLQDLYLRFDWPATPALLRFLYLEADPVAACRLRKWAVALLAWTLATTPNDAADSENNSNNNSNNRPAKSSLQRLAGIPELRADYSAHRRKMQISRADVRIKNPQLRIPGNQLRREDRHFGFRQCSFHSHRRTAGEGHCPHELARREHQDQKDMLITPVDTQKPPTFAAMHSPSSSLSSTASEPRLEDLKVWSLLSMAAPDYNSLGIEPVI